MSELPPQATAQLRDQIEIIKSYAKEVDESQGIVGSAVCALSALAYAQAISASLNQLGQGIQLILNRLPEEKPALILPR